MMRTLVLLAVLAAPAFAEDPSMGMAADPSLVGHAKPDRKQETVSRIGLAVSLAFDATTWTSVGVSSAPAHAATNLIKQGHYRLELLQLVLIARDSGTRLLDLTKERAKGKKTLREMAVEANIDYDRLYSKSQKLSLEVDRRLEQTLRVRSDLK